MLQNLCFIMAIFTFFSYYNSKTNAVRKILISDLESTSKNTLIRREKTFILEYVHRVKLYLIFQYFMSRNYYKQN